MPRSDSHSARQFRRCWPQAVVLCGGLGTRLQDTVPQLPKALAPIGDRPFLDYLLANLAKAGVREVVLCLGYKAEMIQSAYQHNDHGLSISVSVESKPLGTAGALKNAASLISSDSFLLLNGDSLVEVDYANLLQVHATSGAKITITLARVDRADRYGTAVLKGNGEISAFFEKSSLPALDGKCLINVGVYALNRSLLDSIPACETPISLERDVLPKFIGRGIFGFVADGFFIDIGVPEDYARAQIELPGRFSFASSHSC
jgi:D-glycero-alpha-D-manno-heptose 1-phosphate guanylyltransferase